MKTIGDCTYGVKHELRQLIMEAVAKYAHCDFYCVNCLAFGTMLEWLNCLRPNMEEAE